MENEKIYFKEGNIIISSARFIFGNKTYSAQNVTSVSWKETKGSIKPGIVLLIIGSVIIFYTSLFKALASKTSEDAVVGTFFLIVGIGLVIGGIIFLALRKTSYVVVLTSSAAEQTPLIGDDKDKVEKIVKAINSAIIESHKKNETLPKANITVQDKIDKLEKLARLKFEGILTEEEFNEQKKKLLSN